jgi:2'-5' RNA ligase
MTEIEKQANLGGAMICVKVDPKVANQLAVVGGEAPERMHITLAYLGDSVDLMAPDETVLEVMTEVSEAHPKIKASLSGIGRFENADTGEDAVVALVDAPGLETLREHLVHELEEAGVEVRKDHGFTPHITIAYVGFHEQLPVSRIGGLDLRINAIEYVQGLSRIGRTPLRGKVEKAATTSAALDDAGAASPAGASVDKRVVERDGEFCVIGESGKNFGCYPTERQAEERLAEIHTFSDVESAVSKGAGRYEVQLQFPIAKAEGEQRLVYGIVLEPDEVDAQNDTIRAEGIQKTAHNFLAKYNRESEMGYMHQRLGDIGVDLVESYIAPMDFTIGEESVKKGSWLITVKVHDDKLWADVKSGRLTGFSIGGIATILDS